MLSSESLRIEYLYEDPQLAKQENYFEHPPKHQFPNSSQKRALFDQKRPSFIEQQKRNFIDPLTKRNFLEAPKLPYNPNIQSSLPPLENPNFLNYRQNNPSQSYYPNTFQINPNFNPPEFSPNPNFRGIVGSLKRSY